MTRDELSDELHEVWATAAEKLTLDAQLDLALADSFPASDPPALLRRGSADAERGPGRVAEGA